MLECTDNTINRKQKYFANQYKQISPYMKQLKSFQNRLISQKHMFTKKSFMHKHLKNKDSNCENRQPEDYLQLAKRIIMQKQDVNLFPFDYNRTKIITQINDSDQNQNNCQNSNENDTFSHSLTLDIKTNQNLRRKLRKLSENMNQNRINMNEYLMKYSEQSQKNSSVNLLLANIADDKQINQYQPKRQSKKAINCANYSQNKVPQINRHNVTFISYKKYKKATQVGLKSHSLPK